MINHVLSTLAVAILLTSSACTGTTDEATSPADTGGSSATASGDADRQVELTSDRLLAYERGLRRETQAVREARERSRTAATPQERGDAIQSGFEDQTIPLGAEASGLPLEEYSDVRQIVHEVFRTLDVQEKIDGPLSMDLTRVSDEMKARIGRDPFDELTPQSAQALREHMDRLVPVWIEYMKLTAVAG